MFLFFCTENVHKVCLYKNLKKKLKDTLKKVEEILYSVHCNLRTFFNWNLENRKTTWVESSNFITLHRIMPL